MSAFGPCFIAASLLLKQPDFLHYFSLFSQGFVFRLLEHPQIPGFFQCVTIGAFTTQWAEIAYNTASVCGFYILPVLSIIICYTIMLRRIGSASNMGADSHKSVNINASVVPPDKNDVRNPVIMIQETVDPSHHQVLHSPGVQSSCSSFLSKFCCLMSFRSINSSRRHPDESFLSDVVDTTTATAVVPSHTGLTDVGTSLTVPDQQLRQQQEQQNPQSNPSTSQSRETFSLYSQNRSALMAKAKRKTLRMSISIVITFVVCKCPSFAIHFLFPRDTRILDRILILLWNFIGWTPYSLLLMWEIIEPESLKNSIPESMRAFLYLLAVTNSCVNPFIHSRHVFLAFFRSRNSLNSHSIKDAGGRDPAENSAVDQRHIRSVSDVRETRL